MTNTPRSAHWTKRTSPAGSGHVQCSSAFGVPSSASSSPTTASPSSPKRSSAQPVGLQRDRELGPGGRRRDGRRVDGSARGRGREPGRPRRRRPDEHRHDARPQRRRARPGQARRDRGVSPAEHPLVQLGDDASRRFERAVLPGRHHGSGDHRRSTRGPAAPGGGHTPRRPSPSVRPRRPNRPRCGGSVATTTRTTRRTRPT